MNLSHLFLEWLALAALLALLFSLFVMRLRAAQYSPISATVLCLLALAQPAYLTAVIGLRSALFATAAYATATAAAAFAKRQDPRRIVLLGSSLAGAQFIHPVWGAAASIVVPLALRGSLKGSGPGRVAGLYISVLFIPAFGVITLLYLSLVQHIQLPHWAIAHAARDGVQTLITCLLTLLTIGPPLLAAFFLGLEDSTASVLAALCLVVVAISVGLGALGQTQLLECAAALSVLLLLIVSRWPQFRGRALRTAILVGGNASSCWIFALFTPGLFDA